MPKQFIIYNLRDDVTVEDYLKWVNEFKGPLLLGLGSTKSYTLCKVTAAVKLDPTKGQPPELVEPPFKLVAILEVNSLEEWAKDRESKAYKEDFMPKYMANWAADTLLLQAEEIYEKESE